VGGDNTQEDALLATVYNPMYYLYTGRQAIRPGLHRPASYFYPMATPALMSVQSTRSKLSWQSWESTISLSTRSTVDAEGKATLRMLEEVVTFPVTPLRRWFLPAPTVNIKFMK
jgi:hypothetical protein